LAFQVHLIASRAAAQQSPRDTAIVFGGEMILQPLSTAAVTWGVLQQLRGKTTTFTECLRAGLLRMSTVFAVSLVAGLITFAGTMALCVPGLVALTMFFVAAPVAVVEGLGVGDSLRRSLELTDGSRWSIFQIFGLIVLIEVGVSFVALLAFGDFH